MRRKWLPSFLPPVRPKTEGPGWLLACGEIASEGFVLSQWFKNIKRLKMRGRVVRESVVRVSSEVKCEPGGRRLSLMVEDHGQATY